MNAGELRAFTITDADGYRIVTRVRIESELAAFRWACCRTAAAEALAQMPAGGRASVEILIERGGGTGRYSVTIGAGAAGDVSAHDWADWTAATAVELGRWADSVVITHPIAEPAA